MDVTGPSADRSVINTSVLIGAPVLATDLNQCRAYLLENDSQVMFIVAYSIKAILFLLIRYAEIYPSTPNGIFLSFAWFSSVLVNTRWSASSILPQTFWRTHLCLIRLTNAQPECLFSNQGDLFEANVSLSIRLEMIIDSETNTQGLIEQLNQCVS